MGKQSQKTTQSTVYGNTTTTNPYAKATTNNGGTVTNFQPGTALETIYNQVNNNINSLLEDYLNPSLNSVVNQAKMKSYSNALDTMTKQNLENGIINQLSNRNMIRSSQAGNLYNALAKQNAQSLEDYVSDLLTNSQSNTANLINNLMNLYLQGANVINGTQSTSLQTSLGNATRQNAVNSDDTANIAALALQIASALKR